MGMIEVWPDTFEVLDCLPLLLYAICPVLKAVCLICSITKVCKKRLELGVLISVIKLRLENDDITCNFIYYRIVFELQIKILLIKMKKHWHSAKSEEETKILQSYTVYGEKFGYVYAG